MITLFLACSTWISLREGHQALEAGDLSRAEAAWREVLKADPTNTDALSGLGQTYQLAGQADPAREAFQQCIDFQPEEVRCYRGLGSVARSQGNFRQARLNLEEALKRAPTDPATRHAIGLLELSSGNNEKALEIFDTLSTEAPKEATFHQSRAEALLALSRPEEAEKAAAQAIDTAQTPRLSALGFLTRARALLMLSADRVDPKRCAETAPPVYTVLEEANRNVDAAEATGVPLPDITEVRRAIQRRKGATDDLCPGQRSEMGTDFSHG